MERVIKLIQQDRFSEALVCLWVLASDSVTLNQWEQTRRKDHFEQDVAAIYRQLASPSSALPEMIQQPLALMQALDKLLFERHVKRAAHTVFVENEKQFYLLRACLDCRPALANQLNNPASWLRHHRVVPAITSTGKEVKMQRCEGSENDVFLSLAKDNQNLRVWIGHFTDGADVVWDKTSSPAGNWRTLSVKPFEARLAALLAQMHIAQQAQAHIVLFPEFTIDPGMRQELAAWLVNNSWPELIYVMPGSFHEDCGAGKFFNVAHVLAADGEILFAHRKLKLAGTLNVSEYVEVGKAIQAVQTPLGLLTVLICKDFLDKEYSVDNLLQEVPVNWVFVPSFGNQSTLDGHQSRARELAITTTGAHCAVANTANSFDAKKDEVGRHFPGFAHVGGAKFSNHIADQGGLVEFPVKLATTVAQEKPSRGSRPPLTIVK